MDKDDIPNLIVIVFSSWLKIVYVFVSAYDAWNVPKVTQPYTTGPITTDTEDLMDTITKDFDPKAWNKISILNLYSAVWMQ